MHRVTLPSGLEVILSDTVGFISELPHELVAAFRATLEEVTGADLILHVRDIAHPDSEAQRQDVEVILDDLGLGEWLEDRVIQVLNKIDLLDVESRQVLGHRMARGNGQVLASALTGEGLPELLARAEANGVAGVVALEAEEVRRRVPMIASGVKSAILIPGEHVIDPWSAPLAYALQAIANGAALERNCEVVGGAFEDELWRLRTSRGMVSAEVVVNCAGLFGDIVDAIARPPPFRIAPRKGQFVVFDKSAAALVDTVILPVPSESTKGVLIAPTAFGNVLVGPTAEDQDDREKAAVDTATLKMLVARAAEIIPRLAGHPITAIYGGLRPATQFKDYQIEALPDRQWITVAGIRSTGLTGALGIGALVRRLYEKSFAGLKDIANPLWTPVPNLAETRPRPYQQGGSGEIVCHCEWVTLGEIEAAFEGPLPATSFGGLKRRTRCMMGRCQGFYCSWRIAQLAAGRLPLPLATGAAA